MFSFQPSNYADPVRPLLVPHLCELGPGEPNTEYRDQLSELRMEHFITGPHDLDMARCCLSGLWLWHNFLEQSHQISQSIDTVSGSYWHGIMHRREPDFTNAKYWFRKVGQHPIDAQLCDSTKSLLENSANPIPSEARFLLEQSVWDAAAFVDLSAHALHTGNGELLCREVARLEWQLLFDYCYQQAR